MLRRFTKDVYIKPLHNPSTALTNTVLPASGSFFDVRTANCETITFLIHLGAMSEKSFVGTAADDLLTATAHGYSDTNEITIFGDSLPAPLVSGNNYFVRDKTDDTFKVALTSGGAAINLTANGSGYVAIAQSLKFQIKQDTSATQTANVKDVTGATKTVNGSYVGNIVEIEVPIDQLDLNNNFFYLTVAVTGVSGTPAASISAIGINPTYQPVTLPSTVTTVLI